MVTNGPAGQHNIIDNVPGLNNPDDYTPLWQVTTVTWASGLKPVTLASRADVDAATANGWVTVWLTDTVVKLPGAVSDGMARQPRAGARAAPSSTSAVSD